MSNQPTNSTKYQEFHGIKLANGGAFANLVVEKLASDPLSPETGRFWYNTTENKFRLAKFNGTEVVVESFVTASELAAAVAAHDAALAASTGASLVGYVGTTGANSKFSIVAGTLEDAVNAIGAAVDGEIKSREDADSAAAAALAAQTADASGASKVGFDGKVGANSKVTVAAGTVADALDSLVDQVDGALSSLGDDAVSKTATADQTIASNLRILKDVVIDGNITVLGENTTLSGTTVEIGDNIILLNREVASDAEPVASAGWQVNRGKRGTLNAILWDEDSKALTGTTVTTDKLGVETSVRSRVILGTEFDAFDVEVTDRLTVLEDQVNGKIGDLDDLVTEDKTTIVAAVNELHADSVADRAALVAATGGTLVGYAGKAGANALLTVAKGTVTASLDSVVTFVDAEAKAFDDQVTKYASTVTAEGSALVGYAGYGAVEDAFYLPAGTVQASLSGLVVAVQEDRASIASLQGASNSLISAINAQKFVVVSAAAMTHTIVHNLNSQDVSVDAWFKDGSTWVNSSAACKIVDDNTVEFTLTTAVEVKVLVRKFADISL